MKIALIGYGKMGRLVETMALQRGHAIRSTLNSQEWQSEKIENVDICIDFSHPQVVLSNVKKAAQQKKSLVMGTTGWNQHHDEIKKIVEDSGIGFLHSPNFSIGVALFLQLVEQAAYLFNAYDEYEIGGWECHHSQKADAPSGTAHVLADLINKQIKKTKNPMSFSSTRCGSFPGTHSVFFDSPSDTITLTHQARNREGFARGALLAAEWLQGKSGFFTLQDMMMTNTHESFSL